MRVLSLPGLLGSPAVEGLTFSGVARKRQRRVGVGAAQGVDGQCRVGRRGGEVGSGGRGPSIRTVNLSKACANRNQSNGLERNKKKANGVLQTKTLSHPYTRRVLCTGWREKDHSQADFPASDAFISDKRT